MMDHKNRETAPLVIDPSADNQINWVTAFFMAAFHVGAIAALFFFTWKALAVACFLWWVSGSLGIGMGYHGCLRIADTKLRNGSNIY